MIEINNITSIKIDKSSDYTQVAENKWDQIVKESNFTLADKRFSKTCKNRKFTWFFLLSMILIFAVLTIILGVLGFSGLVGGLIVYFAISSFFFIWIISYFFFFSKKTKIMFEQNKSNLWKIKSNISNEIFHKAMFEAVPQIKKINFSNYIVDKFKDYFFGLEETNSDCFIPIYINKKNALLRSFHSTIWTQKAYYGYQTISNGKTSTTRQVVVMWPFPVDVQRTQLIDTTNLAPELHYTTSEVKLKSERLINKFNKKHQSISLENNDFNKVFPAIRSDEQQFRVIFDLTTQENIVSVIKELGPFGSIKESQYMSVLVGDKNRHTFAPSVPLQNEPNFYHEMKKDFIYFFKQTIMDLEKLVAAHLSFSCFSLESEKEFSTKEGITSFEIEQILYSLDQFKNIVPKKSKQSQIRHFNFSILNSSKENLTCLSVDYKYMYSLVKTVVREGVPVSVDDYHYNDVKQYVIIHKHAMENSLDKYKNSFNSKVLNIIIDPSVSYSITGQNNFFVIKFLRIDITKSKIDKIIELL